MGKKKSWEFEVPPPPKRPPQDGCPARLLTIGFPMENWKTLRNSSWKRQLRKPSKSGKRSDILKVKNRHSKQPNNTSLSASYKGTLSSCLHGKILPLSKRGNMSNLIQTPYDLPFYWSIIIRILYDVTDIVYVIPIQKQHSSPGSNWSRLHLGGNSRAFVPAHPSAKGRALWPHAHPGGQYK